MNSLLNNIEINIDEQKQALLNEFIKYFLDYNEKVNLISKNDSGVLFEKHIYDSLAINLFLKKYIKQKELNIMDIGTGGGFPALPISIIYDNYQITAVDSINKKINFIKSAKDILNIKNIIPICSRIEDLPSGKRNTFDIVTTRAMAELRIILEYAIPYVKTGGYFIAFKSIKAEEEIENAKNALKVLNSKITDKIEYTLPIKDENKRVLLVIKKEKATPLIYPRKNGQVKKNPL